LLTFAMAVQRLWRVGRQAMKVQQKVRQRLRLAL